MAANINSHTPSMTTTLLILWTQVPIPNYDSTQKADEQFLFRRSAIGCENLKAVAAGWPEANAILPPAVFDNADLHGEIGQSCIWIIKYSFVYESSTGQKSQTKIAVYAVMDAAQI